MATTDIDGTPLLIFGAQEVVTLLGILEDAQLYLEHLGGHDATLAAKIAKITKFLNDPQVAKWLKENS